MTHPALERADQLVKLAWYVFAGAGALMIVGGVLLAFDDPAALALSVMGLVFVGAGALARKLFATPAGSKKVVLEDAAVSTPGRSRHSVRFVHVDEDADEDAVRRAWMRERWQARADWAAGAIEDQGSRHSGLHAAAAVGMAVLAIATGAGGALLTGILWLVCAIFAAGSAGLAFRWLRDRARRRRFGETRFLMSPCPAVPGGPLAGTVLTGVPQGEAVPEGFRLRLRCLHRYQASERVPGGDAAEQRTRHRVQVLWEAEREAHGQPSAKRVTTLEVPVAFDLPASQPPASLASGGEGIAWELSVTARLPGLDYGACFEVPVLDPAAAAVVTGATDS